MAETFGRAFRWGQETRAERRVRNIWFSVAVANKHIGRTSMKTPTIKNALLLIGVAVAVTISGLIWPFQDTRPEAVLKRQGARFNYGENGTTVIGVWMEGVEFGDDDVALVVGFPKVRDLSLAGAKVTRRGVEQLRSVTTLPSLDLSHTQLTGDALEVVAQLSGLTDLRLAGCHGVRTSISSCCHR